MTSCMLIQYGTTFYDSRTTSCWYVIRDNFLLICNKGQLPVDSHFLDALCVCLLCCASWSRMWLGLKWWPKQLRTLKSTLRSTVCLSCHGTDQLVVSVCVCACVWTCVYVNVWTCVFVFVCLCRDFQCRVPLWKSRGYFATTGCWGILCRCCWHSGSTKRWNKWVHIMCHVMLLVQ